MATVQINGSAVTETSTKNNKGVIRRGGSISNTDLWTSRGLVSNDYYNSGRVTEVKDGVAKGVSAGRLNKVTEGEYIIRRHSETISGVANTSLLSGGSDTGQRDSIHLTETGRKTFLTAISQTIDANGNVVTAYTRNTSATAFATDNAAHPTRSNPGRLVIKEPKPVPVASSYSEKTG